MSATSNGTARKSMVQQRRKARHFGMQALYRWHVNGGTPREIEAEFRTDYDLDTTDIEYFRAILEGVIYRQPDIDGAIAPCLDRDLTELTPVELAVLRQAVYELKERVDVPYKVVISEAVALARKFGSTDGHNFVNGVLDCVAGSLRTAEVKAG